MKFPSSTIALPHLLNKLLLTGDVVPSRNGESRELTMQQITLMQTTDPYMATPGRKASLPAQIAETMWVLAGRNDVDWLTNYLPQAAKFSDDGKHWRGGYGPRLRRWSWDEHASVGGEDTLDQFQYIIDLLHKDPSTRRAVFAIYDPIQDSRPGLDVPCNGWVHFLPRDGKLHTHVAIRSNDVMWGWSGINAFEWSILTQVIASYANLAPGSLTFSISSLHLYERHYDKAQRIVDQTLLADNDLDAGSWADPYPARLPAFSAPAGIKFDDLLDQWFDLEAKIRQGNVSTTEIMRFPELMMRNWLFILRAWWDGGEWPAFEDTSAHAAFTDSPKPKHAHHYGAANYQSPDPVVIYEQPDSAFMRSVNRLHRDKGAVYGNSWRKRGETYSILPNIARKIDRLGVGGAGDTEADTYIDLAVYLAKYYVYLDQGLSDDNLPAPCDDPDYMELVFRALETMQSPVYDSDVKQLKDDFEWLLTNTDWDKNLIHRMTRRAWGLARQAAEVEEWEY